MSHSQKLRPNNMDSEAQLSSTMLLLYAVISGSAVATVYYSQPLLSAIALEFGIHSTIIGTIVTVTQICYAFGLFFLVPLGDLLDPRRLATGMLVFLAVALSIVALASNALFLFIGMGMVGSQAVVAQVLVALAANRAPLHSRGRAIGVVTSGIGDFIGTHLLGHFSRSSRMAIGLYGYSRYHDLLGLSALNPYTRGTAFSKFKHVRGYSQLHEGFIRSNTAIENSRTPCFLHFFGL